MYKKSGFSGIAIGIIISIILIIIAGTAFFIAKIKNDTEPSSIAGISTEQPIDAILQTASTSEMASSKATVTAPSSTNSLFGTMIAFNVNDAVGNMSSALQNGWSEFRKDDSAYQTFLNNLKKLIPGRTELVKETGFSPDRGSFGYFTWNVIEPQKGQFDWRLTDLYAKAASGAGVKISAVIQPFAGWDQQDAQVNINCKMLDSAYFDYKAGPLNDIAEYENFLTKTVERYKDIVTVWEIGNEPDAQCNGYQDNPRGYFELLKISFEAIKKADPKAGVVNGGASGHFENSGEVNFWTNFFQLGGGQYIDYFNLHYNNDRSSGAKLDPVDFQNSIMFFKNLMDKNGSEKPLYITEFGIYYGSSFLQPAGQSVQASNQVQTNSSAQSVPSPNQPLLNGRCGDGICDSFEKQDPSKCLQDCGTNNQQPTQQSPSISQALDQNLPHESENSQAVLYFKDSIIAFANGAKNVFIDLIGSDNDIVGSSMAFNTDGQPRLFLTSLKTINQKLAGFSKVEKIADGQYKFTVGNKIVYALWSGILPKEFFGQLRVIDMNGHEQTIDAAAIKLNADHPVLIEP